MLPGNVLRLHAGFFKGAKYEQFKKIKKQCTMKTMTAKVHGRTSQEARQAVLAVNRPRDELNYQSHECNLMKENGIFSNGEKMPER